MPNRLKELRKLKGLTQKELSLDIGMPVTTIAQYERGDREPKLETWDQLADYFEVPVPYLQGAPSLNNNLIEHKIDFYVQSLHFEAFNIFHEDGQISDKFKYYLSRFRALIDNDINENDEEASYLLDVLYNDIQGFQDGNWEKNYPNSYKSIMTAYKELLDYAYDELNVYRLQLGSAIHMLPRNDIDDISNGFKEDLHNVIGDAKKVSNITTDNNTLPNDDLRFVIDKFTELINFVSNNKNSNEYAELIAYSLASDILKNYVSLSKQLALDQKNKK